MGISSYQQEVEKGHSNVFRKLYIKRMQLDGTYEDDWVEITDDVKRWGSIKVSVDAQRLNRVKFGSNSVLLSNEEGRYNDEVSDNSIWNGFASRQRTLIRIDAGYYHLTLTAGNIWKRTEFNNPSWDSSFWDVEIWDSSPILYKGIVSGDIPSSDKNEINLQVKPLSEVFRQYPCSLLTGFTSTGLTASQFMELLRDQTSGGNYIFRPFFENTTSAWEIDSTSNVYANLNTNTSIDLFDKTVWEVVEKLAEAENYVAYVNSKGVFKFKDRSANTTTSQYTFKGPGLGSDDFGVTIKSLSWFGPRHTKYYSRVKIKFKEENTTSSYATEEASFEVSGTNKPWFLGHKTYSFENTFIQTSTVADTLALNIFNDVSSLKKELTFKAAFNTSVDVLDRIKVTYDTSSIDDGNLWDVNNWGNDAAGIEAGALVWDASRGDAINLVNEEMNVLSIDINLDKLENIFNVRET